MQCEFFSIQNLIFWVTVVNSGIFCFRFVEYELMIIKCFSKLWLAKKLSMILIIRSEIFNIFLSGTSSFSLFRHLLLIIYLNIKDQFIQHLYRGGLRKTLIAQRISVEKSFKNTSLLQIVSSCTHLYKLLIWSESGKTWIKKLHIQILFALWIETYSEYS